LRPILDQAALDQVIDSLPAELLQEQAQQAIAPVIEALLRGRSETEALGLLAEAYPLMDDQALQQTLTRLLFIADTWGRLTANADRED
jgi:phage gp29-like protein